MSEYAVKIKAILTKNGKDTWKVERIFYVADAHGTFVDSSDFENMIFKEEKE